MPSITPSLSHEFVSFPFLPRFPSAPTVQTNEPSVGSYRTRHTSFHRSIIHTSFHRSIHQRYLITSLPHRSIHYRSIVQSFNPMLPDKRRLIVPSFYHSIHQRTSGSKPTGGRVKRFSGTRNGFIKVPGQESMQWMDPWSALSCERIIFIGGYIEENLSYLILSTILHLDSSDSNDPFLFIINSLGGDVHPSLAIYDTMQSLKCPIGTRCVGVAANMAGLLLAAGDKGSRAAFPCSRIWLQAVAGSSYGKVDDVCNEENEINRLTNYIFDQLATKIGCHVEKIYKDIGHSKSFSAQEAIEYGIIDRIVRPPRLTTDPAIKGDRRLLKF